MTKFMMQNKLFNPTGMHPNSSMYAFPPYFYGIESPSELNTSFFHELYLNGNYTYYFISCPSMQMPAGNVIVMIMYALVFIVGLFGNTLVIYAVLRFSKMQTVTNIYILNLGKLTRVLCKDANILNQLIFVCVAIADQCYLIGIPFLIITMHVGFWSFGSAMCKIYMVSTSITQFTSSIFLIIMSADRYIGKLKRTLKFNTNEQSFSEH